LKWVNAVNTRGDRLQQPLTGEHSSNRLQRRNDGRKTNRKQWVKKNNLTIVIFSQTVD